MAAPTQCWTATGKLVHYAETRCGVTGTYCGHTIEVVRLSRRPWPICKLCVRAEWKANAGEREDGR